MLRGHIFILVGRRRSAFVSNRKTPELVVRLECKLQSDSTLLKSGTACFFDILTPPNPRIHDGRSYRETDSAPRLHASHHSSSPLMHRHSNTPFTFFLNLSCFSLFSLSRLSFSSLFSCSRLSFLSASPTTVT